MSIVVCDMFTAPIKPSSVPVRIYVRLGLDPGFQGVGPDPTIVGNRELRGVQYDSRRFNDRVETDGTGTIESTSRQG